MTARVNWKAHERNSVLQHALSYLQQGYTYLEALRHGQQVLPQDRQRTLATHAAAVAEIKALRVLEAQSLQTINKVKTPTAVTETPSAPSESLPQQQADDVSIALDAFVQAIVRRVTKTLDVELRREVKTLENVFSLSKHDPSYEGNRQQKPKIVIIGLLQGQAKIIQHSYEDMFDLKFISSEDAYHATPGDADAFLLMKNFISHSVYNIYQSFSNHVLIDGGMTTLRMWLNTKGQEL